MYAAETSPRAPRDLPEHTRAESHRAATGSRRGVPSHPLRVFDASGVILGRLATEVATALRGKDAPSWVPYRDTGATVVVAHTNQVRVSGTKLRRKIYFRHTPRKPGSYVRRTLAQRMAQDSRAVLRTAVWNMLPKNRLRHRMITRLRLYREAAPARARESA